MNILTFDIEEWAVAKSIGIGSQQRYAQYEEYLDRILELLATSNTRATFFCIGQMAEFFPDVVKRIHSCGHEIGCHSYNHVWMNKMTFNEAKEDTEKAIDLLEQCIGDKIIYYRAPAFSIGQSNKWMFEILAQCGVLYDASVFPSNRDFGGFPSFPYNKPCVIQYNGCKLREYPISTKSVLGKEFVITGGGYFRICPAVVIKKALVDPDYTMCYFHIVDLLPEKHKLLSSREYESSFGEHGSFSQRLSRFFKSNVGKKHAWQKFAGLVHDSRFISLGDACSRMDWDDVPIVSL